MSDNRAQIRLECEAREWLRKGYVNDGKIAELRAWLSKHRGPAAIDKVIIEMRRQWQRRSEWMDC